MRQADKSAATAAPQDDYRRFLDLKTHSGLDHGFEAKFIPKDLFPFQRHLLEWATRKGRCAIFADCGLGKTAIQLAWARNVAMHTGRRVLVLTPLAVATQTVREGQKFGVECHRSIDGSLDGDIVVTNYERLDHYTPDDFAGVVCDESSILKNFDGARKAAITAFMKKVPYRLLATATAAPNDYIELGTSSEALGNLGFVDMLGRFFKNDQNNVATRRLYGEAPKWRFRGHSATPFWRWVTSWAIATRKPSDLGYDDGPFILPSLKESFHIIKPDSPPPGMLFNIPAGTLHDQRVERKRTIRERCVRVADMVNASGEQAIVWCHANDEGDLLESLIPDSIQVAGCDTDQNKEDRLLAFADGKARVLVTKPKIGAWGLNFQSCSHVVYFPSHSYEQYYQSVRRCWRFGQKRPVTVDVVLTEGERLIMENLRRKAKAAEEMFDALVREMNSGTSLATTDNHKDKMRVPSWL